MPEAKELTWAETWEMVKELPPETLQKINRWISRGDWVVVYENQDLGHHQVGHRMYVSYGGRDAQLERLDFPSPPETLPDIGGMINWRYKLVGWYQALPQYERAGLMLPPLHIDSRKDHSHGN